MKREQQEFLSNSLSLSRSLALSLALFIRLLLSVSFANTCRQPEMPKLKLLFASRVLQSVISLSETKLMSFENYLSPSLFTFLFCVVFLAVVVVVVVESGYSCGSGAYLEMKVTHSLAASNFAGRIQVACYEFLPLYYTIYYRSRSLSLSLSYSISSTCDSPNPSELSLGEEIMMKPRLSLIRLDCASPVPYNPRTCPYVYLMYVQICKSNNVYTCVCVCIRCCLLRLPLIGFFGA